MQFLLDSHTHTIASGHAYSTIKENAAGAKKAGILLMAITDHAPKMPGSADSIHFVNYKTLPSDIDGVELLSGVELNIIDQEGNVDLSKGILKNLKVVIASLHSVCIEPSNIKGNTQAVVNAMHNPQIKIIGHLGDPAFPIDIEKIVNTAKATGTIIEINNSSLIPGSFRYDGQTVMQIIKLCKEKNVTIVAGSDAHYYTDVGNLNYARAMIEEVGIKEELVLNTDVAKYKSVMEGGRL